jgi:hypothetical protein
VRRNRLPAGGEAVDITTTFSQNILRYSDPDR